MNVIIMIVMIRIEITYNDSTNNGRNDNGSNRAPTLEIYRPSRQRRLLLFCTGCDRVPILGLGALRPGRIMMITNILMTRIS